MMSSYLKGEYFLLRIKTCYLTKPGEDIIQGSTLQILHYSIPHTSMMRQDSSNSNNNNNNVIA